MALRHFRNVEADRACIAWEKRNYDTWHRLCVLKDTPAAYQGGGEKRGEQSVLGGDAGEKRPTAGNGLCREMM